MKWSFDGPNGGVTIRQEGRQAICQAISGAEGMGLYKAWLRGPTGQVLLGTLIPEGGVLRLRRVLEISQLEGKGAWPPEGAEISLGEARPMPRQAEGWKWVEQPGKMVSDKLVARMLRNTERTLCRRGESGFSLAFPYSCQEPYPLPGLFCLSTLEKISERWYAVFAFSLRGYPEPVHKISQDGENRKGT